MAKIISRGFLWFTLPSPLVGVAVAFYAIFIFGEPYLHEGLGDPPITPLDASGLFGIIFFIWTVFIFIFNSIILFFDIGKKYTSNGIFQAFYLITTIASFLLIAGALFTLDKIELEISGSSSSGNPK